MEHNTKSYRPCIYSQRKKAKSEGDVHLKTRVETSTNSCLQNRSDEDKSRGEQAVKCCKNMSKPNAWKRRGVWYNLKLDSLILKVYCGQGIGSGIQGDRNILNFHFSRSWSLESIFEGFKLTRGCYKIRTTEAQWDTFRYLMIFFHSQGKIQCWLPTEGQLGLVFILCHRHHHHTSEDSRWRLTKVTIHT